MAIHEIRSYSCLAADIRLLLIDRFAGILLQVAKTHRDYALFATLRLEVQNRLTDCFPNESAENIGLEAREIGGWGWKKWERAIKTNLKIPLIDRRLEPFFIQAAARSGEKAADAERLSTTIFAILEKANSDGDGDLTARARECIAVAENDGMYAVPEHPVTAECLAMLRRYGHSYQRLQSGQVQKLLDEIGKGRTVFGSVRGDKSIITPRILKHWRGDGIPASAEMRRRSFRIRLAVYRTVNLFRL